MPYFSIVFAFQHFWYINENDKLIPTQFFVSLQTYTETSIVYVVLNVVDFLFIDLFSSIVQP